MRRSCKACLHERRAEIDQAIREGIAYRIIAEGFDLGLATISRHKDHMEQPGTAAEQDGTRRNAPEADVTESYTEQRVAAAEQPAEQSGTERDKAEQPAGHDNTGQAVLTGVIETLRGEIAAQRETLNRLLQDQAKEALRHENIDIKTGGARVEHGGKTRERGQYSEVYRTFIDYLRGQNKSKPDTEAMYYLHKTRLLTDETIETLRFTM